MVKKNCTAKESQNSPPNLDRDTIRIVNHEDTLYKELSLLIEKSKQKAVFQVKSTVNILFWQVGEKINDEILHNEHAEYGAQIVTNLAIRLTAQYGQSFELKNLRRMMQSAEQFSDRKIVVPLARQLSLSEKMCKWP